MTVIHMPTFGRYVGIDYSGARNAHNESEGPESLCGRPQFSAAEIQPPPSPRKYWTRRGIAEWLESDFAKTGRC